MPLRCPQPIEVKDCNLENPILHICPEEPSVYFPELLESGYLNRDLMDRHPVIILDNVLPSRDHFPDFLTDARIKGNQQLHRDMRAFYWEHSDEGFDNVDGFSTESDPERVRTAYDTVFADYRRYFLESLVCIYLTTPQNLTGVVSRHIIDLMNNVQSDIVAAAFPNADLSSLGEEPAWDTFIASMVAAIREIDPDTFRSTNPKYLGLLWRQLLHDDSQFARSAIFEDPSPVKLDREFFYTIKTQFYKWLGYHKFQQLIDQTTYRHRWQPNQIVLFNNSRILHAVSPSREVAGTTDKPLLYGKFAWNDDGKLVKDSEQKA